VGLLPPCPIQQSPLRLGRSEAPQHFFEILATSPEQAVNGNLQKAATHPNNERISRRPQQAPVCLRTIPLQQIPKSSCKPGRHLSSSKLRLRHLFMYISEGINRSKSRDCCFSILHNTHPRPVIPLYSYEKFHSVRSNSFSFHLCLTPCSFSALFPLSSGEFAAQGISAGGQPRMAQPRIATS